MFTSLAQADATVVTTARSKSVPVTEVIVRISSLGVVKKHEHMSIVEADGIDRLGLRMSVWLACTAQKLYERLMIWR